MIVPKTNNPARTEANIDSPYSCLRSPLKLKDKTRLLSELPLMIRSVPKLWRGRRRTVKRPRPSPAAPASSCLWCPMWERLTRTRSQRRRAAPPRLQERGRRRKMSLDTAGVSLLSVCEGRSVHIGAGNVSLLFGLSAARGHRSRGCPCLIRAIRCPGDADSILQTADSGEQGQIQQRGQTGSPSRPRPPRPERWRLARERRLNSGRKPRTAEGQKLIVVNMGSLAEGGMERRTKGGGMRWSREQGC